MVAAIGVAVILVVGIVALEWAARWWITRSNRYFVRSPYERIHMKVDPVALPSLPPEAWFEVNAEGERGDPLPADRTGLFRILVAGGSAAECMLLDQRVAWPGLLQDRLNEPSALKSLNKRRVHVGNIGRSLTPCDAVCTMLERTLPRYERLDVLLLMVGASDVLEWLEAGTPSTIQRTTRTDDLFAEHPERRFGWKPGRTALRRLLASAYRRYFGKVYRRKHAGRRLIEFRRRREQATHWVDQLPDPKPMLDHFENHFRRLVEIGRKKGARVILVRQPWLDRKLTLAEERLMWNFSAAPLSIERVSDTYYTHEAVRRVLRQADEYGARLAAELGIQSVDLCAEIPLTLENFYDYHHFTEAGSRRVADAVLPLVLNPAAGLTDSERQASRFAASASA